MTAWFSVQAVDYERNRGARGDFRNEDAFSLKRPCTTRSCTGGSTAPDKHVFLAGRVKGSNAGTGTQRIFAGAMRKFLVGLSGLVRSSPRAAFEEESAPPSMSRTAACETAGGSAPTHRSIPKPVAEVPA